MGVIPENTPLCELRWSIRHKLQQKWKIGTLSGVSVVEWRDVPYEEASGAQTQPLSPHTNDPAPPESVAAIREYILGLPHQSTEPNSQD